MLLLLHDVSTSVGCCLAMCVSSSCRGLVVAENYLMREQPVGWLEELSKLESMTAAAASPHLLTCKTWPVKFRLINRDTVLPSQVTT